LHGRRFPDLKIWNYNDFMTIEWMIPLLLGWLSGWVVNYLSDVLPITRRFSEPVCLQCGATIPSKDYLLFQRCPNGHPRSMRVWLVQIGITALSLYTYLQPSLDFGYWAGMLLLIYFGIVFVIDMEHKLILHPTSIVGSLLALILGTVARGLPITLFGGLIGFVTMLVFYYFGVLFARFRAMRMRAQGLEADDEESLGQGDIILVTILGFLVGGWELISLLIILSIILGGIVSLFLILGLVITRRYNSNALMIFIPFGPYFIIGAALIVYFPGILKAIIPN
jgi:Type IV leader peptidase family